MSESVVVLHHVLGGLLLLLRVDHAHVVLLDGLRADVADDGGRGHLCGSLRGRRTLLNDDPGRRVRRDRLVDVLHVSLQVGLLFELLGAHFALVLALDL